MTEAEYAIEWEHEYLMRLGMMGLSAGDMPTPEQDAAARIEADNHIEKLRAENSR